MDEFVHTMKTTSAASTKSALKKSFPEFNVSIAPSSNGMSVMTLKIRTDEYDNVA